MHGTGLEKEIDRQFAMLTARCVDVVTAEELRGKLRRSLQTEQPLRVKLGLDPTAPDLHIGHTVVLHKLREFQDLGHDVIFLIGDFTGRIGDPTGRSETRKPLTAEAIRKNGETYKRQLAKILDPARTIIDYNSRWGAALGSEGLIKLAAQSTVARMLERDDFHKRFVEGRPIGIHEFLYPLLQGHDSVELRADVELGGTDQKFNLLVGRDLQREAGQEAQVILTLPILEGLDGVQKMSKSLGNYIGIDEEPRAIFGKAMSVPDELTLRYLEFATAAPRQEIAELQRGLADGSVHPREAKVRLAKALVTLYHPVALAEEAARWFAETFSARQFPEDAEVVQVDAAAIEAGGQVWIIRLVTLCGKGTISSSEASRLVRQGGVKVDGKVISERDDRVTLDRELRLQVGKRRFFKVLPPEIS